MTSLRFAVLGDPIAHSRSPAMHRAAYAALGLPHVYDALRVAADELPGAVGDLRRNAFAGLNITVPHKRSVLSLVDEVAPSAVSVGAANTLVRSPSGTVIAHNTDAPALAQELRDLAGPGAGWADSRALVIGSGGAALAAVAALAELGTAEIAVRARSFSVADRRDAFVRAARVPIVTERWQADSVGERATRAVVQATSAGMAGADPGEAVASVVDWEALSDGTVVFDVVYSPRDTPFLSAARRRGLRSVGGIGMLARQGALAFEAWLDRPAPFEVMRAALDRP
ncbi:MAG: shikimate dehydrogenase [Polyangiaceae bacterium]|jgi:shikimate dehydrogenase